MVTTERAEGAAHRAFLALVAVLTAAVLILTAGRQIYDSNLNMLTEATALLAGDHPYRDFFEWGAPLAAYLSAGAQLLVGYRLIGEFLLQWLLIIAGVVISFHLGLRLSRSIAASLAMLAVALVILADTPTYHSSKLFFFPLTIWVGWWYIDHPGVRRGAVLGALTAIAFLVRHDYGVYIGLASVVAFALARLAVPASRGLRPIVNDSVVYAVAAAVTVMPWAVVVQLNEGLVEYTQSRATRHKPGTPFVWKSLLELNPLRPLDPGPPPAPTPAVVGFFWAEGVNEARRQQLERQFGLRLLDERDARGRWQYQVSNVYDMGLFRLDPYIRDGAGFKWDRLRDMQRRIPAHENVELWLFQVALVVPLLLLIAAGLEVWRRRCHFAAVPRDALRMALAGIFLTVADSALFREPSYMVVSAPLTAALSARFLTGRTAPERISASVVLLLTSIAAVVWARETLLFRPSDAVDSLPTTVAQLLASPPDNGDPTLRYFRECTAPDDRLIVSGNTPFHVSYYAQRPVAGGHLYWHYGWRSDPAHEEQSLALLKSQSVPFAFSPDDPILDDFRKYPRIREYLVKHYAEVEGSNGLMLVDTRRQPTRRYGPNGYPCFR